MKNIIKCLHLLKLRRCTTLKKLPIQQNLTVTTPCILIFHNLTIAFVAYPTIVSYKRYPDQALSSSPPAYCLKLNTMEVSKTINIRLKSKNSLSALQNRIKSGVAVSDGTCMVPFLLCFISNGNKSRLE